MVDQAKDLMCDSWWCVTKAPLLHVAQYYQPKGTWYSRCLCKPCLYNVTDVSISVVKEFDTKEERDLWLIKQRL